VRRVHDRVKRTAIGIIDENQLFLCHRSPGVGRVSSNIQPRRQL
jgi:hypothetical protein